jgi:imidazolonepropionase-like amidohydrolase
VAERDLAIVGGTVWTGTGEVLDGATVVVQEGKIAFVGTLPPPAGAEVVRADGMVVMPGLIDMHTHLGLHEEGVGWEGNDGNELTDPVTPQLRAIDAIHPGEPGLRDAVRGGVTTAYVTPGSGNVIGGQGAAVATDGSAVDAMVRRFPGGIKAALGENPKRVYRERKRMPTTRLGTAAVLREALARAQAYADKLARAGDDPDKRPERDLRWEALGQVLRGDIPLRVHAHRADDILTALRVAREFGITISVEHATEGYLVARELADAGVFCHVGPALSGRSKVELMNKDARNPVILQEAGVKVCLVTDHPVMPIELLPLAAGLAVREGMPVQTALRAVTALPAEDLGLQDRLGTLEPGKEADLVMVEGFPFDIRARVRLTVIRGHVAHRA